MGGVLDSNSLEDCLLVNKKMPSSTILNYRKDYQWSVLEESSILRVKLWKRLNIK